MRRAENVMSREINELPDDATNSQFLLIHAASQGQLAQIARLINENGMDVDTADYDGRTPLHLALAEGE